MPETMAARIQALQRMTTAELREEWRRLLREEPRSYNRIYLLKRVIWATQAVEYGGLSARAKARLEELLPFAESWMPLGKRAFKDLTTPAQDSPNRDPRLPSPGSVLTRSYRGKTLCVTVLEDGFEFEGKRFESLTSIATAVTGSHWNGWLFFFGHARKTG